MASLEFLESVDLFKDLNDSQLTAVQGCCEEVEFNRGEKIFNAGDDPDYLWIVKEGQVELIDDSQGQPGSKANIISTLSRPQIFGWSSLAARYKYRFSAYCTSRSCKFIKIKSAVLSDIAEKDHDMGYKMMSKLVAVIGTRFQQFQDEMASRLGHDIMNQW